MKAKQLITKYATEIKRVREANADAIQLRLKVQNAAKAASAAWTPENLYPTEAAEYDRLSRELYDAEGARNALAEDLHQRILHEYMDVPFAKPAQQGIKRFYELAGLG